MFSSPQVIAFSEDLERAVAFYVGLDFREGFRVPTTGEPIHVDLVLDGYKLGIASVRDDHGLDPLTRGQRAAVVLWTDDVRGPMPSSSPGERRTSPRRTNGWDGC